MEQQLVYSNTVFTNISGIPINITQIKTNQDLLEEQLGPRYKNLAEVIVLLVIYGLVFISGTVGNVCTCIVILRNTYMRTTTNYYLLSLAISDVLILLIGLPPEAYSIWDAYPWRFGKEFCIVKALSTELTSYASVLTITAFTIERYIAICRPFKSHKIVPTARCIRIIIAIWIISLCCALPFPLYTDLFYYVSDSNGQPIPESLQCNIPPRYSNQMLHMFQMSTFVFFIFPLTIIVVLYSLIGLTLRRAELHRRSSDEYNKGKLRPVANGNSDRGNVHIPRKCVLKVLVAVVVAFFVCWAPFHAQRLLTVYNKHWTPALFDLQSTLFYISGVLYFIGSTVNPILYNVMSRRYRLAFMHTICNARDNRQYSSHRLTTGGVSGKTSERRLLKGIHQYDDKTYDVLIRYSSYNSFDRNRLLNAERRHASKCMNFTNEPRCNDVIADGEGDDLNGHVVHDIPTMNGALACNDIPENDIMCRRCSISGDASKMPKCELFQTQSSLSNGIGKIAMESVDTIVMCDKRMIENDMAEFV